MGIKGESRPRPPKVVKSEETWAKAQLNINIFKSFSNIGISNRI